MKTSVSSRKVVSLPDSVRQRLHPYTLAATAAGVTMLALVPPGEAEIIYTPANVTVGPDQRYGLDVTGDGTTNFYLGVSTRSISSGSYGGLWVSAPQTGNSVAAVGAGRFTGDAKDLPSGRLIGPKTKWGSYYLQMEYGRHVSHTHFLGHCVGPWKKNQNGYLGLKFMISGEVHYGWAAVSVTCYGYYSGMSETLTGYAYETIPNKAIKAGQETGTLDESLNAPAKPAPKPTTAPVPTAATLGTLARGAQALSIWRQE
ncbi:MAG: hypothetical protein WBQ43_22340 [Terriglobales bacterium]